MLPYISTKIPETLSVKGIITVFKRKFLKSTEYGSGEAHDFPELIYIEHGSRTAILNGKEYKMNAGDALIYAPRAHHTGFGEESDVFIISFELDAKTEPSFYNKVISLDLNQREALKQIVDEAAPCFTRRPKGTGFHGMTLNEGVSEYTLEKIKRRLELFLLELDKAPGQKRKDYASDVAAVKHFCLENLAQNLTLSEIARGSGMSVSKLKLIFRESFGAINFFNELKIDEAKRLIREEKLNFTEISDKLGFSSLHYFSRLFKKKTGKSPSEYKALHKED
jgi:AraC-like DNA-binding protein